MSEHENTPPPDRKHWSWDGKNRGRFKPTGLLSDCPPVLMLRERIQSALEEFHAASFEDFNLFWERLKSTSFDAHIPGSPHNYPPPPLPIISTGQAIVMPNHPGIYFVWTKDIIVYVGQSGNLRERCKVNGHDKITPDDRLSWIEFEPSELYFAECFYIGTLRPERNLSTGTWGRRGQRRGCYE